MKSASKLVNLAFSSISIFFLISTVLYGGLISVQTAAERARSELRLTVDAAALIIGNEIFSGNLILARERLQSLVGQQQSLDRLCLAVVDSSSGAVIFSTSGSATCDKRPVLSEKTIFFDRAETQAAFKVIGGISPLSFVQGIPPAAWFLLGSMAVVMLALNIFFKQRFQLFIEQIKLALRADWQHDSSFNRATTYDEVRSIANLARQIKDSAKDSAIARMTQMLAHDVRKPFSILRMGLGMLNGAKDPPSVKKVLSRLVPEIDKAVSSVDGLIADVMEVGSTSTQLIQEPVNPESLMEATIGEIFRIYPKSDISIAYDLKHVHMVNVHAQKVGRVFFNIVGNAVQAMNYKGEIWFKTRERDDLVEFCIGNAGSVIPAESLPKLFDAFFTSGKKGGTGLGLAIAQKVVTAHGGKIWCESAKTLEHPDGKVEFLFTLPIAKGHRCKSTAVLTQHSSEITGALSVLIAPDEGQSVDKGELTLEADIVQAREQLGHPLRILVVDDEPIYRNALASYLSRTPEFGQALSVVLAANSAEALEAADNEAFDLVITDVDMGPESLDGFELVRELRARKMKALICVHSNRIVAADHQTAIEIGADAFLPKPMARAQLLRLALQAAEREKWSAMAEAAVVVPARQGAVAGGKAEVLIIDDNIFVLEAWESTLSAEATVHLMTSLEALKARLAEEPQFLDRLAYVVTDMHLDGSAGDGLDVGRLIKRIRPELRVLLSSDGHFAEAELVGAVDAVIEKDPVSLSGLSS